MAKMACYCGASMSNVDCPSENIIYVLKKERIESALKYNPQITLIDFITNWDILTETKKSFIYEDYDFWYCTQCKSVYKSETKIGGNKLAAYAFEPQIEVIDTKALFSMQELIVFSDLQEDKATEKEPPALLSDFVSSISNMRYFITDDQSIVYVYDCKKKTISYGYRNVKLLGQ